MQYQLKTRQVCLFFIAFLPLAKLFMMPSVMADNANEDMWMCALLSLLLDFLTAFIILKATAKTKQNVYQILESKLGKTGSKFIAGLFLVYFLLKSLLPLNEQKEYVIRTLYTLTPTLLYFLPFFFVCFYFCTKPLRVIGRASDVLWLITSLGIIILLALSIGNFELSALLPVGANGIFSVVKGSYQTLTWFGDGLYLLFFMGEYEYSKKDNLKILASFIVGAITVILFVIVFYCTFTSIAFRQRFALTEISKYSTVINNIGRFDYIGIMMILFSNIFSLSVPLFFATKLLNYIFSINKKWLSPLFVVLIQAFVIVFLYQRIHGIEVFVMHYLGVFFFIVANVLPIIICLTIKKEGNYAIKKG